MIVDSLFIIVEWGFVLKLIDMSGFIVKFKIFFNGFLVVLINVKLIFFIVIGFFIFIIKLISDMFGVGIWSVILWSFFFKWGRINESVLVVLVVVGIIDWVYVWVFCKFLCGLLIFFWLFVYVWMVVIKLFLIVNVLFSILIIGVR